MIFARRTPHTPATLFSPTDGLDMKVSTRQKQGATRHKGGGAKGDNSASWVSGSRPGPAELLLRPPHRSPNRTVPCHPEILCQKGTAASSEQECRWQAAMAKDPASRPKPSTPIDAPARTKTDAGE